MHSTKQTPNAQAITDELPDPRPTATEYVEQLARRPLTAAETQERRLAASLSGDARITLDGKVYKPMQAVHKQRPPATTD